MQDYWTGLRRILIEEFSERGATRQTSRHDVAGKRFGFHDRHIGFARNGKKIVRRAAMDQAGCPEVKRPNPATNKYTRFNRRAQTYDANVIAVLDLKLARKLRRDLSKHLRLQFREMTQKTRHATGRVVFSQTVGRQNVWKSRVTRRREPIFLTREPALRWIGVARIKLIRDWRLERLVMSGERSVLQTFWYVNPAQAVFMQNEWRIARNCIEAFGAYL